MYSICVIKRQPLTGNSQGFGRLIKILVSELCTCSFGQHFRKIMTPIVENLVQTIAVELNLAVYKMKQS